MVNGSEIHTPLHEFEHDPVKLRRKSSHARGRVYKLQAPTVSLDDVETVQVADDVPSTIDLSKKSYMPPVLDQGSCGSCASNSMANTLAFVMGKEGLPEMHPSRLALYYNARVLVEGSPADQDTGVAIADMCEAVRMYHACPESDWPYDISKFMLPPPPRAVADSEKHVQYKCISVPQDLASMKSCLAEGFPIMIGIQVYTSFESEAVAETGIVPLPDTDAEQCLGGHAQTILGASDRKEAFLSLNSWGPGWGLAGYSWIPYKYILDPQLASDFWSVRYFK